LVEDHFSATEAPGARQGATGLEELGTNELALGKLGTGNMTSMIAVHGQVGSVINRIKGVRSQIQCRHSV
jgi:hypothetical protein